MAACLVGRLEYHSGADGACESLCHCGIYKRQLIVAVEWFDGQRVRLQDESRMAAAVGCGWSSRCSGSSSWKWRRPHEHRVESVAPTRTMTRRRQREAAHRHETSSMSAGCISKVARHCACVLRLACMQRRSDCRAVVIRCIPSCLLIRSSGFICCSLPCLLLSVARCCGLLNAGATQLYPEELLRGMLGRMLVVQLYPLVSAISASC